MTTGVQFRYGMQSITGNFRENNEDNCFVDAANRYFLVADGMGGQSAGEKASELAIELIAERLNRINYNADPPQQVVAAIDEAVCHANMEIMAMGELDPTYHNMGTTIVFLVWANGTLFCGGVGDSRVYLLRKSGLEQLTTDHSLTQALLDAGTISEQEAATHRYKNVLYRYLGTKEGGNGTDPRQIAPESGDRYLLCSDGVTDGINESVIARILTEEDDPQKSCEALVNAALDGGSKDNITAIVVHVV